MNAGFKVAVAGQHGRHDQIVLGDGLFQMRLQRAGVADTGGAAVADGLKAQPVQIGRQAGLVQILGDDARTGRQRSFDRRADGHAPLDGLFRQQSRRQHDAGVGRIGAARNGGNHHVAVTEFHHSFRKLAERDVLHAVRRGPVLHHLDFGESAVSCGVSSGLLSSGTVSESCSPPPESGLTL